MSAIDAIRAREAAKRPPPPEPESEPVRKRAKKENTTDGRQAIEGDAGGSPPPGEPEAGTEAPDTEEVTWQS